MWKLLSLFVSAIPIAGLVGCAPTNSPVSATPATVARPTASGGTILSMREVTPQTGSAAWRAGFLAASGASGAAIDGGNGGLVEFIVRTDDGSTLSVVQPNTPGFRAGDRVIILR